MERMSAGRDAAFVEYIKAHPEPPSNIHSIELARTNRAIEQMRRSRATPERPL
jgi:hypothetical protein